MDWKGTQMSNDTALLVIDMQVELVEGAYQQQAVLDNINTLLAQARASHTPVIYVQHNSAEYAPLNYGVATWQIHPALAPQAGEPVVHKRASDSFYHTTLQQELEKLEVKHLVITGMQTEQCVDTTCRSAISAGYDVTLVADAHTTGDFILPAAQIIAYHNALLPELAHPDHSIEVKPTAEIVF